MDKSVIILTTFWDANSIINDSCIFVDSPETKKILKINFTNDNYTVNSIALQNPDNLPDTVKDMKRLNFFCPTYNMLTDYKSGGDWETYTKDYKQLIKSRRNDVKSWFDSLKPNHIYILCCWENTKNGANCHRKLLGDIFKQSKTAKDKLVIVYRDGSKAKKKEEVLSDLVSGPRTLRAHWTIEEEGGIGGFRDNIFGPVDNEIVNYGPYSNPDDHFIPPRIEPIVIDSTPNPNTNQIIEDLLNLVNGNEEED